MSILRTISFLIPLFFIMACSSDEDLQADQEADYALLEIMEKEIMELANTECINENSCKYVALGAKPCGGPWTFLIYSITGTDEQQLLQKVENFNTSQRLLNQKYGAVSDCAVVLPPNLTCLEGKCQAAE